MESKNYDHENYLNVILHQFIVTTNSSECFSRKKSAFVTGKI